MSILCDTCTCSRKCGECTVKECRKSLDFTVIGTPKGKGRPRFTSAGGRAMAYTPKATKEAEEAVKEAFSKALGTGVRGFSLIDVEVLRNDVGKPYINLYGSAKELCKNAGVAGIFVSLSHSKELAMAYVVLEKE